MNGNCNAGTVTLKKKGWYKIFQVWLNEQGIVNLLSIPMLEEAGYKGAFFLVAPPLIQNRSPTKIFGTPSFGAQKLPFNVPPTVLKLAVRILQILNFVDIPGMSTSSIMSFHNSAPKLVH